MNATVSPAAAEMMSIMVEETRLPVDWETSGVWLTHLKHLAQLLADNRSAISFDDATRLVAIGGLLAEMAKREYETGAPAERFFN